MLFSPTGMPVAGCTSWSGRHLVTYRLVTGMLGICEDRAKLLRFEPMHSAAYHLAVRGVDAPIHAALHCAARALVVLKPETKRDAVVQMLKDVVMYPFRGIANAHPLDVFIAREQSIAKERALARISRYAVRWTERHYSPEGPFVKRTAKVWANELQKRARRS
tara:strand:- start:1735 stop:2223 length:489 start_codon:yes stop_codon:yes gene_type:complete